MGKLFLVGMAVLIALPILFGSCGGQAPEEVQVSDEEVQLPNEAYGCVLWADLVSVEGEPLASYTLSQGQTYKIIWWTDELVEKVNIIIWSKSGGIERTIVSGLTREEGRARFIPIVGGRPIYEWQYLWTVPENLAHAIYKIYVYNGYYGNLGEAWDVAPVGYIPGISLNE